MLVGYQIVVPNEGAFALTVERVRILADAYTPEIMDNVEQMRFLAEEFVQFMLNLAVPFPNIEEENVPDEEGFPVSPVASEADGGDEDEEQLEAEVPVEPPAQGTPIVVVMGHPLDESVGIRVLPQMPNTLLLGPLAYGSPVVLVADGHPVEEDEENQEAHGGPSMDMQSMDSVMDEHLVEMEVDSEDTVEMEVDSEDTVEMEQEIQPVAEEEGSVAEPAAEEGSVAEPAAEEGSVAESGRKSKRDRRRKELTYEEEEARGKRAKTAYNLRDTPAREEYLERLKKAEHPKRKGDGEDGGASGSSRKRSRR